MPQISHLWATNHPPSGVQQVACENATVIGETKVRDVAWKTLFYKSEKAEGIIVAMATVEQVVGGIFHGRHEAV